MSKKTLKMIAKRCFDKQRHKSNGAAMAHARHLESMGKSAKTYACTVGGGIHWHVTTNDVHRDK